MEKHWIDKLADRLEEKFAEKRKQEVVISGGLSVSGLQHIGRLRGEVLIGEALRRELEKRGFKVTQYLILYTQDAWKGKEAQLKQFSDAREAEKYRGWPLIKVPDPKGCHDNWVDHYWSDFGGVLDKFTDGKIRIMTTTELYRGPLKKIVIECINRREEIRRVINKYRGRNPYPEGWIPFEPICGKCGRIDSTKTISYSNGEVEYECTSCGYRGSTSVENGKLNWRLEWAALWVVLGIDFEPYGKDHATPGGSRDSCVEIARTIFRAEPPEGTAYEWVAIRIGGRESDMSSSDFIGMTPREWLEIAHAEVLRYIYFKEEPRKKILIDPQQIPLYYDDYYKAEKLFYKARSGESLSDEECLIARSYELAQIQEPPEKMPIQPPYATIALIVQSFPENTDAKEMLNSTIKRLRSSGIIDMQQELSEYDVKRLEELLRKTRNWVNKYAPPHMRYKIIEVVPREVKKKLRYRERMIKLGRKLLNLKTWNTDEIKKVMIEVTSDLSPKERREFYAEFYTIITGEPKGPRAAPLIEVLGKGFVEKRLVKELEEHA